MSLENDKTKEEKNNIKLEDSTYEIIRNRLLGYANELQKKLNKLNKSKNDIFGQIEFSLIASERITTSNNCMPRDMISIYDNYFIFGYNVYMGLKSSINIKDVFSVYEYKNHSFQELDINLLNSNNFYDDFQSLYKYYKNTEFAKFSFINPHLFMVFKIGKSERDFKTFKWIIDKDNKNIKYIDNRSDHEFKFPQQHEFKWLRTDRDHQRKGDHPHISIEDRVFVEAVGGDITFKVEDNTETGQGIYAEPVDNKEQTLDDAEIFYALAGHIIFVKIKPYMEENFRYFIFNEKTNEVCRVDEIKDSCIFLPEDQGLIFSNGYYLQTGELKKYDNNLTNMLFENIIQSANGQDYLYTFYNNKSGAYILMPYNIIEQNVENQIICNGYSCFDNGEMLYFNEGHEATKHHVVQIWQTPFIQDEFAGIKQTDNYLSKIGSSQIVKSMAECNELLKLINREKMYNDQYVDIFKKTNDIYDSYFWLAKDEAFNIKDTLEKIKIAASNAIDEFEKLNNLKKNASLKVSQISQKTENICANIKPNTIQDIDKFVNSLNQLRQLKGEIISSKDIRYVDLSAITLIDNKVSNLTEKLSKKCVEFLIKPESLLPYEERINNNSLSIPELEKVSDAKIIEKSIAESSNELEMLIEIVSNLKIEDSSQSTAIIDKISEVYSKLNQTKQTLKNKKKSLSTHEGKAQFNAQFKLLNQSLINFLDLCTSPQKCDQYLSKIMIQVEELETKFIDFDEYIEKISEKRNEIYNAFENKKLSLVESRNKRANSLASSAQRILKGIESRVFSMKDINQINSYFASDMMIEKIRDIVKKLIDLDDSVKADDIESRLKTIKQDAVRQLKDRQELFVDGENIIQMGPHKFSVNVLPLDITIVMKEDKHFFHLTGTDFFEEITDKTLYETKTVWDMELPSENNEVSRAEFLAYNILKKIKVAKKEQIEKFQKYNDEMWLNYIRDFMGPRYSEAYVKGVHDFDAAKIIKELFNIYLNSGLLRFNPEVRALSRLFWTIFDSSEKKTALKNKLKSFGDLNKIFPDHKKQDNYILELKSYISDFLSNNHLFSKELASDSALYLFYELSQNDRFVISKEADMLLKNFLKYLKELRSLDKFNQSIDNLIKIPESRYELIRDWIRAYTLSLNNDFLIDYIDEASVLLFVGQAENIKTMNVIMSCSIDSMLSDHNVIKDSKYNLNYIRFIKKLNYFENNTLVLYNKYQTLKKDLSLQMAQNLRLDEFKPRVLTSFVRNKLINDVYLPLIGNNCAKQIGVVGENKRTDLMGMLLLISPPGYGKTTLMEYIANRLGIIFMKINGPAIGHNITSLDPSEAVNASAKQELFKLSLSLEMGDNVMIYLDDIQHLNPEFLQKFISLCDAQRKIEGVYKGKSKTYDLRGKKVVVVMAGNPYTESGEKFKIPDMLANRADTYNLGDIIGNSADSFKMSYLENALTSNPILNKLSSKSQKDIYNIIHIAEKNDSEGLEFESNYSKEDISEMVSVMKKLIIARDIILKVNSQYIFSAGQSDEYRTEPAFKLQGSYRNMNRLAEKIVPVMNDEELKTLILSDYENEAQTLTTGAYANILKFKELVGWLTKEEEKHFIDIKKKFQKNQLFHSTDSTDPINRVIVQLSNFEDGLISIKDALSNGINQLTQKNRDDINTKAIFGNVDNIINDFKNSFMNEVKNILDFFKNNRKNQINSTVSLSDNTFEQIKKIIEEITNNFEKYQKQFSTIAYQEEKNNIFSKKHFFKALKNNDFETVKNILEKGQSPDIKNSDGATPLMAAALNGNLEIFELLIEKGADINEQDLRGYSPLMIASAKGYEEIIKILLKNNANIKLTDNKGMTALKWAQKNNNDAIVEMLSS